jgi:xylulokinase
MWIKFVLKHLWTKSNRSDLVYELAILLKRMNKMEQYLLGIDIGTTATKIVIIHPNGTIVKSLSKPVDLYSTKSGWSEEDPEQWWENVRELIPALLASTNIGAAQIAAVGVSGMVPALLFLDASGKPLRRSIQQNDARAVDEINELKKTLDQDWLLANTGSVISQQSIAPKLMWIARHEPEVWSRTASICGSYDYITRCLTGHNIPSIEANWAMESGLYHWGSQSWSDMVCEAAGVKKEWLGQVITSSGVVGTVQGDHRTGLLDGTPVIAGAADHVASAFSAGVVNEGDMLVKLGGAGDILMCSLSPITDPRLYLDYHLIPDHYLPNGCMAASGSVIRWFQQELAGGTSLEELDQEAEMAGPGANGLVMLPYFLGEKTPINDPEARGMFVGLHLGHKRGHLYRAILEGIGFGFYYHVETFRELGLIPNRVRITNGGSRSRVWRQILADISGLKLESIIDHPGSSLGAAFAAGMGVGIFTKWEEIEAFIKVEETIIPNRKNMELYRELYGVYRSIYPGLLEEQHQLARISQKLMEA